MSNTLEPEEIKRVKLHRVKCSQCKANLMIKPRESVSCLWGFVAQAWEALTALNILCDAKFQPSVD
jgi:hypothetical protein